MNRIYRTTLAPAWVACATALVLSASSTARAEPPRKLDWDKPVRCIEGPDGKTLRVQCTRGAGATNAEECLVAPNHDMFGEPVQRVKDCDSREDNAAYRRLLTSGARIVPAMAEAPLGYDRGPTGRAVQVKFDLLNRVYLGAGWTPTVSSRSDTSYPNGMPFGRGMAEFGVHISHLSPQNRARHDLRLFEGAITFADFEVNGTLVAYDFQHSHARPRYWLTTFFGDPKVFPVRSRLGWGFRLLSVFDRPPSTPSTLDVELAEAHLAYNAWQSEDMYSRIRIEVGGNTGGYSTNRWDRVGDGAFASLYAGPTFALRSRFALGEGGLHFLFSDITYRRSTMTSGVQKGVVMNRFMGSMSYEGVILAINNQPVSFRLTASASSQNDLFSDMQGLEFRFFAGLRLSFWAPPRVFQVMPALEDP
jgi:hypothetical protein